MVCRSAPSMRNFGKDIMLKRKKEKKKKPTKQKSKKKRDAPRYMHKLLTLSQLT